MNLSDGQRERQVPMSTLYRAGNAVLIGNEVKCNMCALLLPPERRIWYLRIRRNALASKTFGQIALIVFDDKVGLLRRCWQRVVNQTDTIVRS